MRRNKPINVFFVLIVSWLLIGEGFGQSPKISSQPRHINRINVNAAILLPPNISYNPAVNTYIPNTPITTLTPANTGGPVPPNIYGQVTTFAGNAVRGSVDGTGNTAGFAFPNYLVRNASGLIYVTDGNKLIRQITPGGTVTTLAGSTLGFADGQGSIALFNAPAGMAIAADGNIYVVDSNNKCIRIVTPGGAVSTLPGVIFKQPNGILIDAAGNLFISDYADNTIKKVSTTGVVSIVAGASGTAGWVDGPGATALFNGPNYMIMDAAGNIYIADYNNNLIRMITPSGMVSTFTGNGQKGYANGIGAAASFNGPEGLAIGTDGSLYVSDSGNNIIRKISPAGIVTTLAGNGVAGLQDGFDLGTSFNTPHGLTIDGDGNMLCADVANSVIRKIITTGYTIDKKLPPGLTFDARTGKISGTPTTVWPTTIYTITGINAAGSSSAMVTITVKINQAANVPPAISYNTPNIYNINQSITPLVPVNTGSAVPAREFGQTLTLTGSGGNGNNNGDALTSSFSQPSAVAVDAAGNVYVADFNNNLIRKVSPTGLSVTFAGSGSPGFSDGAGAGAEFNGPGGIVIDAAGNLYVADSKNNRIRKITPGGLVTTVAGKFVGSADGNGTSASFNNPTGITIDGGGNLYVADTFNNLIRKINPAGDVITLAGNGSTGSINSNTGTSASFNAPQNLTVDAAGNVYVTDSGNNLIRKIAPAGAVSTYAGTGSAGGTNGALLSASFNKPWGIVADDIGDLFISDFGGNQMRMIDPYGNVITLAGSGSPGALNNTGNVASFFGPKGLALDAARKLYVADSKNNVIRTVYTTGYRIDKPLPSGLVFDDATGVISGTPNVLSPLTTYTVTAYNIYGSSVTTVDIKVTDSQTITFPPIPDKTVCDVDFDPGATSSSAITYTSSNIAVATIVAGKVHITGAGTTTITAADGTSTYPQPLTVITGDTPSVTISPATFDECSGIAVTYTATPINGGTTPHYQWKVNGQNSGPDNSQFISSNLNNNDKITCVLTSSITCASSPTAVSNQAVFTLDPPVSEAVTITSSVTDPVCAGTEIKFTATPAGPGANITYQWLVNGNAAGTNSPLFSSASLANGDMVTCVVNSSGKCLTNPSVTSNAIMVSLNPFSQCVIVIPNTFTPNNDGINDLWNISALQGYPYCTITVFSRYGSLIYKSTGYAKAWDGTYNNSALPVGTYYYIIDLKDGKKPLAGAVTIIR
ncbi:T9SS type B sorting domain-containing protein [Mucilaginibacter xinganensis]|uniref:Ig-like domain-containing protein n=1 Tax=Mucilaginibacter xinganensis TaxID=1234841 RepID=A0A223P0K1_9SPHI|nr:gliding motility-associated C-terminal domain-containing protein [Mucilaginibacter xinganensis]ASU35653.1 hypothetical protein MuYL_3768 [Mucilaginibacter xinganensis]